MANEDINFSKPSRNSCVNSGVNALHICLPPTGIATTCGVLLWKANCKAYTEMKAYMHKMSPGE